MVNPDNMKPISEEIEIDSDNLAIDEWSWTIPAVNGSQQSMIQITLNQQQWHDVFNLETGKSFEYYRAPHVTSISPSFGHVKTDKE
jgi:hypothetical protein